MEQSDWLLDLRPSIGSPMEFGCFLTMPSPTKRASAEIYSRAIEQVQRAEQLGFGRVWLAEHHFSTYSYCSSPVPLLAHLAALTSRVRLGTAIVPVPLHHPLLIAEQIATLDVLSGGRVEMGLGKGYQRYQFERLEADKDQPIERYTEAVTLIQRALEGSTFTFEGDHFQVPDTHLFPQPLQKPVPLWLVVNTKVPPSVDFALSSQANIFTGVLEPFSYLTSIRDTYPQLCERSGDFLIGTQRPVYVTESPEEITAAIEAVRWNARVGVSQRYDVGEIVDGVATARAFPEEPSDAEILEDHVIFGDPETCIERLRQLETGLGCNYFSGSFWFGDLPQDKVLSSMKRFAEKVMPALS